MATKWKSRIFMFVWALLFTVGISGIISVIAYGNDYVYEDYYHTPEFQREVDQFAGFLSLSEFNDTTIEEAKQSITITEENMLDYAHRHGYIQKQIDQIHNDYNYKIEQAEGNKEEVALAKERDEKIDALRENLPNNEYLKELVKKEKIQRIENFFNEKKAYLTDFTEYSSYREFSFLYYFKNRSTGKVYTNINLAKGQSVEEFMSQDMLYVKNLTIGSDHFRRYIAVDDQIMNAILPDTAALEGRIALPASLPPTNSIIQDAENYKFNQIMLIVYALLSLVAMVLWFLLLKRSKRLAIVLEKWRPIYNKLPIDIRFLLAVAVSIFALLLTSLMIMDIFRNIAGNPLRFYGFSMASWFLIGSLLWGMAIVQGKLLHESVRDWENLKKETGRLFVRKAGIRMKYFSLKVGCRLKEAFWKQSSGTQVIVILVIVFGLGLSAIMMMLGPVFVLFYMVLLGLVGIAMALFIVEKIGYFNQIVELTNQLAAGNLVTELKVTGKSVLATLAGNLNVLKQGLKTSQNEQAKSERLKTELITNVSHDLRTPLTSIITYTELLKKEAVSDEERNAYLGIIDRKSKRLKVLIDDLFEVSKMVSGTIELKREKVDLVQLLQQALAEYDDLIKDSSLQFRVKNDEKQVYALVDGQKLWRVFDNLIGNILKYSLENSRVYITMATSDNDAIITFKNVSKYELNENSEELFERFKRGDTSRHTEGSGLGLAISQSIVELHQGRLDIETDGDLFKATIILKHE